MHDQSSTY